MSPCRFCGDHNGSGEYTDGVLAWPEGLAHYIRDHQVRLPEVIEQYILGRMASLEKAHVVDAWWVAGSPDPHTVGDPPLEPVERLVLNGNVQLLGDPTRRFPGFY